MFKFLSMKGLGDNIYQRAFVKELAKKHHSIMFDSPWPEIYKDIRQVHCVLPKTKLRTQLKNVQRYRRRDWAKTDLRQSRKACYGRDGIFTGMEKVFGVKAKTFDLPSFKNPLGGRYAVIRPASIRDEWPAPSRNPKPEYLCECAETLLNHGIDVISIADLNEQEKPVLPLPKATKNFHKGEFSIAETLGLVQNASIVVGGIGWIVPAAIAYKRPSWFVCGGWGTFNSPKNLIDETVMDLRNIHFELPDNFCMCNDRDHDCDKRITNHASKFERFLERISDLVP